MRRPCEMARIMSALMRMVGPNLLGAFLLIVPACSEIHNQEGFTADQFTRDFDDLWVQLRDNYAYFDQKETDWSKVREVYRQKVAAVRDQNEFITFLERVLDELYDPHTHLKVNTNRSTRLIPTGL